MLRPLIASLGDKLVKSSPFLQQNRTVINLTESLTRGKSAVAIAFGSNLVGNCDHLQVRAAIWLVYLCVCPEGRLCVEHTSCNQAASKAWHRGDWHEQRSMLTTMKVRLNS